MKHRYNPNLPPRKWWSDLDEAEQMDLVETYHRKKRIDLPDPRAHAAAHVMVENQALLRDRLPVAEAIERLRSEGLTRHDALHAVGLQLFESMDEMNPERDPDGVKLREEYYERVRRLTAAEWLGYHDSTD